MASVNVIENRQIAHVRLNRPDVRNAFNPEMIEELTKVFTSFAKRRDLRAVTLVGEGKIFCAGADLSWMKAMVNYSFEQNREDSLKLFAMFDAIASCPLPVIGLAHGAAFGGALGLLACCDQVVAEDSTQFCFSEVKLGIAPAVISAFVQRKASIGAVRPFMLSGKIFDSTRAQIMGLVHEICPAGQGQNTLEATALAWLEAGPEAVRETKRLLDDLAALNHEQRRDRTTRLIAERRVSTEGQEGLKSFLEKRAPSWRDS